MAINEDIVTRIIAQDKSQQAFTSAASKMRAFAETGTKQVNTLNAALTSTIGKYVAMGAAVEVSRRAFRDFADIDSLMRKISMSSGDTLQRVQKLTPIFHEWARVTGKPVEEIIPAFDSFRKQAHLSLDDAERLFHAVAKGAKVSGAEIGQMSTGMAAYLRNLKGAGNDIPKLMDMFSRGQKKYNLDIGQLMLEFPRLTELMEDWNIKGVKGVSEILGIISRLQEVTGDTGEAVQRLLMSWEMMGNEQVAMRIGMSQRGMMQFLRQQSEAGENVVLLYASMIDMALKNGLLVTELGRRERMVWRSISGEELPKVIKKIEDFKKAQGEANKMFTELGQSPKKSMKDFELELDELFKKFGELLVQINYATGPQTDSMVRGFIDRLETLRAAVEKFGNEFDKPWYERWFNLLKSFEQATQTDMPQMVPQQGWMNWFLYGPGGNHPWFRGQGLGSFGQGVPHLTPGVPGMPGFGTQGAQQFNDAEQWKDRMLEGIKGTVKWLEILHNDIKAPSGGGTEGGGAPAGGGGAFDERFGNWMRTPGGSRPADAPAFRRYLPGSPRQTPSLPSEPGGATPGGAAPGGGGFRSGGLGTVPGSSPVLAADRARMADELNANPQLRDQLAGLITLENEGAGTAVAESLFNRASYTGTSVRERMFGGRGGSFYGPIRRGQLGGAVARLNANPARKARINKMIDDALGGSNIIKGATDQGSGNDPNVNHPGGRMKINGEIFNDWGGGPGGHAGARRFREDQQRRVRDFNANPENRLPPLGPPADPIENMKDIRSELEQPIRLSFQPGLNSHARLSLRSAARSAFEQEWMQSYSDVV